MLLKFLCIIGLLILAGGILWIIHSKLLLPIRTGPYETISVRISASGEAPELEMQLRGLLWLRSNGIIPCSIHVIDNGLTAEAGAALRCFAEERNIIVSDGKQC